MASSVVTHSELRHLAIAGAGLAGARTAFSLRKLGYTGTLTLLNAEQHPPYDRPPLSKELFTRSAPALLSTEQGVDVYELANRVLDNTLLRAIHPAPSGGDWPLQLHLATAGQEENLGVDGVVLATGARALQPPAWAGVRTLRTLDDAGALRASLNPGAHLVIVGAGWIGAEVAAAARAVGMRVSVVEAGGRPFARVLPPEITEHLVPWFAQAGVELRLASRVTQVVAAGSAKNLVLEDGTELVADEVLIAVGVRGNADGYWPGSTTVTGLIPVDGELRPTAPGPLPADRIRVVGDLAGRTHPDYLTVPTGHWDFALHDGELAAASLLRSYGATAHLPLPPIRPPYVFSELFGRNVAMLGMPSAGDRLEFSADPSHNEAWAAHWYAPGSEQLRAVFTVNDPRALSAARRKFRNQ